MTVMRRSAFTLVLLGAAGTAAAQGSPSTTNQDSPLVDDKGKVDPKDCPEIVAQAETKQAAAKPAEAKPIKRKAKRSKMAMRTKKPEPETITMRAGDTRIVAKAPGDTIVVCAAEDTSTKLQGSMEPTETTTTTTTDTSTTTSGTMAAPSTAPSTTDTTVTTTAPPRPPPQVARTDVNIYTAPPPRPAAVRITTDDTLEKYGIALSLGGGVEDFASETADSATRIGGGWNVRATIGTRTPLGLEVGYIGSAQEINALGVDNDALLISNGLDAKARVNLTDWNVQPFGFAGVGWRHYQLTDEGVNTSAIANSDDVLEVPMGVGIAYKYRGMLLDARGEFRYSAAEDLIDAADPNADLHRWGVNANLGYAF